MLINAKAKFREGRRWHRKAMSAALRNGTDKHGGAMAQTRTDLRGQSRGLRRFAKARDCFT